MNPQDRVSLNGMLVFPFSSVETLIEYTDRHKGILVAVNAEKVAKANDETCKIVNDNKRPKCKHPVFKCPVAQKNDDGKNANDCKYWKTCRHKFIQCQEKQEKEYKYSSSVFSGICYDLIRHLFGMVILYCCQPHL